MNCFFGRSGYRRRAFRYIFARLISVSHEKTSSFPNLVPEPLFQHPLAKDAAPIPNALEATISKARIQKNNS